MLTSKAVFDLIIIFELIADSGPCRHVGCSGIHKIFQNGLRSRFLDGVSLIDKVDVASVSLPILSTGQDKNYIVTCFIPHQLVIVEIYYITFQRNLRRQRCETGCSCLF